MACLARITPATETMPRRRITLLWTDSCHANNELMRTSLMEMDVDIVLLDNTEATLAWLADHSDLRASQDLLCVITNQNRPEGIPGPAGPRLVDRMRAAGWGDVAVFIFCSAGSWKSNRHDRLDIMCGFTEDSLFNFLGVGRPGIPVHPISPYAKEPVEVTHVTLPIDPSSTSPATRTLRLVIVSDTHLREPPALPYCDYVIHAGDFCVRNRPDGIAPFVDWVKKVAQPCSRYGVIVVEGNHDNTIDWSQITPECRRLKDEQITLDGGLTLFGAGWYGSEYGKGGRDEEYEKITGANIVLTHQPPGFRYLGIDMMYQPPDVSVGSEHLRAVIESRQPLLHIFGHNHDAYSATRNGTTAFIAAAACDGATEDPSTGRRPPVVVDVPVCLDGRPARLTQPFMGSPDGAPVARIVATKTHMR